MAQGVGVTAVVFAYTQFLNLVFGSCWLFIFIVKDITWDVTEFSFTITTTTDEDRNKLTKSIRDIVQIFSDAKQ